MAEDVISIDDAIGTSLEDYETLEAGSRERRQEAESITDLYKARTEEVKVSNEYELSMAKLDLERTKVEADREVRLAEANAKIVQAETQERIEKKKTLKDYILGAVGIAVPAALGVWKILTSRKATKMAFKFEEEGTIGSSTSRNIIRDTMKLPNDKLF